MKKQKANLTLKKLAPHETGEKMIEERFEIPSKHIMVLRGWLEQKNITPDKTLTTTTVRFSPDLDSDFSLDLESDFDAPLDIEPSPEGLFDMEIE